MAQPYLDQLEALLITVDLGNEQLVCKHFFSGAALYATGSICASLTPKGLAFKLAETRCQELIAVGDAIPLRYFEQSPIKRGYVLMPDYQHRSQAQVRSLLNESIRYATANIAE